MPISRRLGAIAPAAVVALIGLATPPAAWPQASKTSETFKTGGPIPYSVYLKRTHQAAPTRAKPKPKPVGGSSTPAQASAQKAVSLSRAPDAPATRTTPRVSKSPNVATPPSGAPPAPKLVAIAPPSSPAPPRVLGPPAPPAAPARAGAAPTSFRLPEQAPVPATLSVVGARLAPSAPLPAGEVEAFVDGAVRQAMGAGHIAGAAVVVVQDGQVVLQKGYGVSHQSPARPVNPRTTLFRLGSVSKVLTWIEVLKQVDAGRLSLDAPIDDALPDSLKLGLEGFKEPVRLRHLMAHTAGFEARDLGRLFKSDPRRLLGPEAALRKARSRRVREAGRLTSYSNYGVALAGAAAANVAKTPFDTLMDVDLLRPAGLNATTFREPYPADPDLPPPMPDDMAGRLSDGFRWTGKELAPQPTELGQDFAPALSASASPQDMGRLMQMLLGAPAPWSPRVIAALLTPLPPPLAGLPGWTHGLQQLPLAGGFSGFGQGGATLWSRSRLLLAPQLRLGVFVVANSPEGQALVDRLPGALVTRFYGPAPVLHGAPSPTIDASRYAGLYLTTRRAYHGLEAMWNRLTRAERVSVGADGWLHVSERDGARAFLPDGSDRFVSADGAQTIAFVPDPQRSDAPIRVLADSARAEGAVREGWVHEPLTLGLGALVTAFTALLCLSGMAVRQFGDNRQTRAQALAAGVQTIAAVAWLFAIGAAAVFLRGAHDPSVAMYRWPNGWLVGASWAALAAALLGVVQMVQLRDVLAETRRRDSWTAGRRARHILSVLVFVAFPILVAMWGGLEPWSS